MKLPFKQYTAVALLAIYCLLLSACGKKPAELPLHVTGTRPLSYATEFTVEDTEEGPLVVTVSDDRRYVLVSKDQHVPEGLPTDVTVLEIPVKDVYLAGSSTMDLFVGADALDTIAFSALKADAWNVEEAKAAMEAGDIVYAGKYSAPDYELLSTGGCGLAVENTMVYHSPSVVEQLERLGIPVLIDCSSRETSPEGRMEWVKLYGLLTGNEVAAERAFAKEEKEFLALKDLSVKESDRPTVAFFSVHTNGTVTVRRGTDYIPNMIERAGGAYLFFDLGAGEDSNRSSEVISMEEFYTAAKDADYFIFNSTIEGERQSISDLLADAPVLKDCKAVQEHHVFCTTKDFYQHTLGQGTFLRDLHTMLSGGPESQMEYLFLLK